MAGNASSGGSHPRYPRRTWMLLLVLVLVGILAVSATLYYVLVLGAPAPNTPPHDLSIGVTPATGNTTVSFHFAAHVSDDQDPVSAIQVRWDWQSDGAWDTAWSTNKSTDHTFSVPGTYTVRMEAEDRGGLTGNASLALTVAAANSPPVIHGIEVRPSSGTVATVFNFTANVSDDHDPASAIQVRWDWQGDGIWDTTWSTTKAAQHQFAVQGNQTVAVEAMDTAGLFSHGSIVVFVAPEGPPPPSLRIGTIFSLTGALQPFGAGEQNGVTMAVDEINAAGGVLGQPIQLFTTDDQTNPATAASAAFTLVNTDHVDAIIGATGSGMCAQIVPIAVANGVPEVSPSCTSPIFSNLTYTGGWFSRTVPSDALQVVVAAHFAYDNRSWRKVSVIAIDNAYGHGVAVAFADNFTRLGGQVLITEYVPSGQPGYTSYLQTVFSAGTPDAVYLIAYPDTGVVLMRDWWANRASWPTNWTFSDGVYDQNSFINPLISSGVNVSQFEGTAPAPYAGIMPGAWAAWAARYQNLYGPPVLFAANAYDAAYLVALAAEAAGNVSGTAIRSQLRSVADPFGTTLGPGEWTLALTEIAAGHDINYEGASGSVDIGAHGDVPGSMIVWGVNETNQLIVVAIFNESFVASLSPSGTYAGMAAVPILLAATWSRRETI